MTCQRFEFHNLLSSETQGPNCQFCRLREGCRGCSSIFNYRSFPQAFKGKLNVRRLVVDRVLDSGRHMMDEYHGERAAGEAEGSSRSRIAGNIDRQLRNVDDQWSRLCQRSDDWQKNVDESLRVG